MSANPVGSAQADQQLDPIADIAAAPLSTHHTGFADGQGRTEFLNDNSDLRVVGVGASPYTRKLRAALRFRRLPFRFVVAGSKEAQALPASPMPLVPYLVAPDGDGAMTIARSDTTPILSYLDDNFHERRLRPIDPALRLIDLLIEDYADEWLSKCMFHYRWTKAADTSRAGAYLPYARMIQMTPEEGAAAGAFFANRQISRLGIVGSNAVTAPVIEASWRRFLKIFDSHIQNMPFMLGERPGAGDFAIFGQMTMLVITDPTPSAVAFEVSPRAYAWTERCEDLSGLEVGDADWVGLSDFPSSLKELLIEIGRVYVPFLLANAEAIERGAEKVRCEIDGQPWEQDAFKYQHKCLQWLRDAYSGLSGDDRLRVDHALMETGCERLFAQQ